MLEFVVELVLVVGQLWVVGDSLFELAEGGFLFLWVDLEEIWGSS